jgi:hypothetical protein
MNNSITAIRVSIDQHVCTLLSLRDNLYENLSDLKISWNWDTISNNIT